MPWDNFDPLAMAHRADACVRLSAGGNDHGYERVFERQVPGLGQAATSRTDIDLAVSMVHYLTLSARKLCLHSSCPRKLGVQGRKRRVTYGYDAGV